MVSHALEHHHRARANLMFGTVLLTPGHKCARAIKFVQNYFICVYSALVGGGGNDIKLDAPFAWVPECRFAFLHLFLHLLE